MIDKTSAVQIAYYTGTGGTALVSRHLDESFRKNGSTPWLTDISRDNGGDHSDPDFLVLAFPVHAFNAPDKVAKWIDSRKPSEGKEAAVISVSGGGEVFPNKACRADSIRRLEKKGYRVVYESMIVMPANCFTPTKDTLCRMLLNRLPHISDEIVKDLLEGKIVRSKPPLPDRIASSLGELEKSSAKRWGARIRASEDCTSCGWCESSCPENNIKMIDGKPHFGKACNMCLRCIYGCPVKALYPGVAKYMILKEGYDLQKMMDDSRDYYSPGRHRSDEIDIGREAKGPIWAGVRKYLGDGK